MQGMYTAASGMQSTTVNIDVIANNLANLPTTGFKRMRPEFQDLLYMHKNHVGTQTSDTGTINPTGVQVGLGVKLQAVYSIPEQGPLEQTSSKFDLAVNGKGFFKITLPDGTEAYTRAGSFQVSGEGQLVTAQGYTVSPGISVPQNATDVTINQSGEVLATIPGTVTPSNLGQIEIVRFLNESGLELKGNNLAIETVASGSPTSGIANQDGFGSIMQGYLEGSNVVAVTELTNMIKAQRAYEMNLKVVEGQNDSMKSLFQSI